MYTGKMAPYIISKVIDSMHRGFGLIHEDICGSMRDSSWWIEIFNHVHRRPLICVKSYSWKRESPAEDEERRKLSWNTFWSPWLKTQNERRCIKNEKIIPSFRDSRQFAYYRNYCALRQARGAWYTNDHSIPKKVYLMAIDRCVYLISFSARPT